MSEEPLMRTFRLKKRGGSYYLILPKDIMETLKISEDDKATLATIKGKRKVVYDFGEP